MAREPEKSSDPLVMKVRELLKSTEPRPAPLPHADSLYGYPRVECPNCGSVERKEGYNHHWTYYHGERFWKEKALIALIRGENEETSK